MELTMFADGGSRGNPGPAASGVVLYDETGQVVREVGHFLGVATNNVAEWDGLISGMEAALELGASGLVVRMDSELVVKQMLGIYRVKHANLIPLHRKATSLARRFGSFAIGHVRRNENAAADAVVNRTLDAHAS
jgi:ribonuclease HI